MLQTEPTAKTIKMPLTKNGALIPTWSNNAPAATGPATRPNAAVLC